MPQQWSWIILLGLLSIRMNGMEVQDLHLTIPATATTSADVQRRATAFWAQQFKNACDQRKREGHRQELLCLQLAQRFLQGDSNVAYQLHEAAAAAIRDGSQDPLMQWWSVVLDFSAPSGTHPTFKAPDYSKLIPAIVRAPYPPFCRLAVLVDIQRRFRFITGMARPADSFHPFEHTAMGLQFLMPSLIPSIEDGVIECLESASDVDEGWQEMSRVLIDAITINELLGDNQANDRLIARISSSSHISPWWSEYLMGMREWTNALSAESKEFRKNFPDPRPIEAVPLKQAPEGQPGPEDKFLGDFERHADAACRHLLKAWRLHPDRVPVAVPLLSLAGRGWDTGPDEVGWFKRIIALQPDYMDAYFEMEHIWLPEGGDYGPLLRLAAEAADTRRFDTEIPWELMHIVAFLWEDAQWNRPSPPPELNHDVYDRCLEVANGYEKLHPQLAPYYATYLGVMAYMCGMPQDVLRQLDRAGDTPDPDAPMLLHRATFEWLYGSAEVWTKGRTPLWPKQVGMFRYFLTFDEDPYHPRQGLAPKGPFDAVVATPRKFCFVYREEPSFSWRFPSQPAHWPPNIQKITEHPATVPNGGPDTRPTPKTPADAVWPPPGMVPGSSRAPTPLPPPSQPPGAGAPAPIPPRPTPSPPPTRAPATPDEDP